MWSAVAADRHRFFQSLVGLAAALTVTMASLVLARPSSAEIAITLVDPHSGALRPDSLSIFVEIVSSRPIATAIASVADRSALLQLSPVNCCTLARGGLSLAGLPRGALTLTVTVSDVDGLGRQAQVSFVHDNPPGLDVLSPGGNALARPDVRVTARCMDDSGACRLEVSTRPTSSQSFVLVGSASGVIDIPVSLSDGANLIAITAVDDADQRTSAYRNVYAESSPSLVLVGTYAGPLLDIDSTSVLMNEPGGASGRMARVERGSGWADTIDAGSPPVAAGRLTAGGVIWMTGQFSDARPIVREWRPATGTATLATLQAPTLRVAGRWASWYLSDPAYPEDGGALTRHDTLTGDNLTIAPAVAYGADVDQNGDVAFHTCVTAQACGVHLFYNDRSSSVFVQKGRYPLIDGGRVVFEYQHAIMTTVPPAIAGPVEQPGPDPVEPGKDYQVAGDWIAFTRSTGGGARQVWRMGPGWTQRVVAVPSNDAPLAIEHLTNTGEMTLVSARRRYLSRREGELLDIGSSAGRAVFLDKWYVLLGPHLLTVVPRIHLVLTEGSNGSLFTEDLVLLNPNPRSVSAHLVYLLSDGRRIERTRTFAANSQTMLRVDEECGLGDTPFSLVLEAADGPLIAERHMRWGAEGRAGHASPAASSRLMWTFAEGAQGYFDTFFLFTNETELTANVGLTFLVEGGAPVRHVLQVRPQARGTFWAGSVPALINRSFATLVEADVPIGAERSMYFGPNWRGGHSSGGIPSLSSTWWLAEGATGPVFTTFLLFANPHPRPVEAHLRLVTDFGATVSIPIALPPRSRRTIDVARLHPALAQAAFATRITTAATDPIAVERAMYWSFDGGPWREGHASAGATASAGRWALADGRAFGPEHDQTYILVANASDTEAAEVSLRLLAPDGRTVTPGYTYHVPAGARRTIDVNFLSRVPQRFGAIVESTNRIPIVVERSMYWDTDGVTWAGGTNVVATPLP